MQVQTCCHNEMRIQGDYRLIKKFREACANGEILQYMHPIPAVDSININDWCIENWGVREEICKESICIRETRDTLIITFKSAGAPPIGAISFFVRHNNGIHIELLFFDPTGDFGGLAENGILYWGSQEVSSQAATSATGKKPSPQFEKLDKCFKVRRYYKLKDYGLIN